MLDAIVDDILVKFGQISSLGRRVTKKDLYEEKDEGHLQGLSLYLWRTPMKRQGAMNRRTDQCRAVNRRGIDAFYGSD